MTLEACGFPPSASGPVFREPMLASATSLDVLSRSGDGACPGTRNGRCSGQGGAVVRSGQGTGLQRGHRPRGSLDSGAMGAHHGRRDAGGSAVRSVGCRLTRARHRAPGSHGVATATRGRVPGGWVDPDSERSMDSPPRSAGTTPAVALELVGRQAVAGSCLAVRVDVPPMQGVRMPGPRRLGPTVSSSRPGTDDGQRAERWKETQPEAALTVVGFDAGPPHLLDRADVRRCVIVALTLQADQFADDSPAAVPQKPVGRVSSPQRSRCSALVNSTESGSIAQWCWRSNSFRRPARHQVSMLGRRPSPVTGGVEASSVAIHLRVSAGSITSSISNHSAMLSALPCS